MTARRVLITAPHLVRTVDAHRDRLSQHGIKVLLPPVDQRLTEDALIALLPNVEGAIVGDEPLTKRVLESTSRLQIVAKWGIGVDNIDLEAASRMGIQVTNTPGMFGDEVADVVIGYLILLARRLHLVDRSVRQGNWSAPEGVSLAGRTIGVIGLGSIGAAVATRAHALGMRVIGYDISAEKSGLAAENGVEIVEVPELLRRADAVSLNCPLTKKNHHLIDASALVTMKPGAWIINTARGALIDEEALAVALQDGRIGAAALDVFETEPLPADSPLRAMEQVILGAHNSSNTAEAVHRTSVQAIDNLAKGLEGNGRSN